MDTKATGTRSEGRKRKVDYKEGMVTKLQGSKTRVLPPRIRY